MGAPDVDRERRSRLTVHVGVFVARGEGVQVAALDVDDARRIALAQDDIGQVAHGGAQRSERAVALQDQYVEQAVRYLPHFNEEVKRIGARVKAVKATFRGSWSVVLESPQFDSMEIELGRALTQGGPINRLRQVLDSMDRVVAMLKAYPERIDARYKNAFAVQLPPQAYVAAQTNPADKTAKPATNSSKTRGR